MSKIVMIIPPERFRDEELFVTMEELENNGHTVVVVSTKIGIIYGSRGGNIRCEIAIDTLNVNSYDAVVFVGGGGSKLLFNNQTAINIAKEMNKQNKIVCAICLAPVILANAGVLKNKRATVSGNEARTIESKGAHYTGPGVTVDGNIITANAPKASRLFGKTICEVIANGS